MTPSLEDRRRHSVWADVPRAEFYAWTWQVQNRVRTLPALAECLALTDAERRGFTAAHDLFRFGVTPYYLLLADPKDEDCPIRRQIVPRPEETEFRSEESSDPLGEELNEAAPNLIHRYEDRALLLVTDHCPVYCRFCTRRRIVGHTERSMPRRLLDEAMAYLSAHEEIKEVILSGGDALMLADRQLGHILERISALPHIEVVRIASRMPVTCPSRITTELVATLRRFPTLFMLTHFNHVREWTMEARAACARMVDNGVLVYNQSVLLRGINDELDDIRTLNRALIRGRVTPYYLHQCDMAQGIEHFRTPIQRGLDIIDGLRGHVSGLMVPHYCIDVPGGLGKVTMQPEWRVAHEHGTHRFRTYQGRIGHYPDAQGSASAKREKPQHSDRN